MSRLFVIAATIILMFFGASLLALKGIEIVLFIMLCAAFLLIGLIYGEMDFRAKLEKQEGNNE